MRRRRHYNRLWIAAHPLGFVWLVIDGFFAAFNWLFDRTFVAACRYAGRGVRARRGNRRPATRRP